MVQADFQLMLVYNADGGFFNAVSDTFHKLVSPQTYPCSLCALTYGAVSMRRDWRAYLDSLPMPVSFHYRDDFARDLPGVEVKFPAILLRTGGSVPRVLLGKAAIDDIASLDDLIARVRLELTSRRVPSA